MSGAIVAQSVHSALPGLADAINAAVGAAETRAKLAMEHALKAGELLNRAKTHVAHGDWQSWLTRNCAVAPRTAQAYMRLSKTMPLLPDAEAQRVADMPVREAVRAIATAPESPQRTAAIRIKTRTEAQRAAGTFQKSAAALRDAAKWSNIGVLDARRVQSLRSKLQAAMNELDRLAGAGGQA